MNVIAAVKQEEVEKFQAEMSKIASDGRIEGVGEYKKLGAMLGNDSYWEYLKNNEEEMKKVGNAIAKPIVEQVMAEHRAEIYEEEVKKAELQVEQEVKANIRVQETTKFEIKADEMQLVGEERAKYVQENTQAAIEQRAPLEVAKAQKDEAPARAKIATKDRVVDDVKNGTIAKKCDKALEKKSADMPEGQSNRVFETYKAARDQNITAQLTIDYGADNVGLATQNAQVENAQAEATQAEATQAEATQAEASPKENAQVKNLVNATRAIGGEEAAEKALESVKSGNANEEAKQAAGDVEKVTEEILTTEVAYHSDRDELKDMVYEGAEGDGIDNYKTRDDSVAIANDSEEADLFAAFVDEEVAKPLMDSGMAEVKEDTLEEVGDTQSAQLAAVDAAKPLQEAEVEQDIEAPTPTEVSIAAASVSKSVESRSV